VTVPSVTGDTASDAVSALTAAGLNVVQTSQTVTHSDRNGIVIHQSPGGNSTVRKGSSVTITVGHYTPASSSSTTTSTTSTTSSSTTSPTTSSSSSTSITTAG
jgi:beta-lactam-binding protein with PASTA domain